MRGGQVRGGRGVACCLCELHRLLAGMRTWRVAQGAINLPRMRGEGASEGQGGVRGGRGASGGGCYGAVH